MYFRDINFCILNKEVNNGNFFREEYQCTKAIRGMDNDVKFVRTVSEKELGSLDIESDDLPYEESIIALDAAALRLSTCNHKQPFFEK